MKKIIWFLFIASITCHAQDLTVDKQGTFMGSPYELVDAPNGAWVNKDLMTDYKKYQAPLTSLFVKKEIVKVADGIYSIQGIYVGTTPVIETKDGVILYDTGENPSEGREILRLLETVTKKPVTAVIYSHSHYIYGTSAIKEKYPNVKIVAHPKLNENVTTGFGVGSVYPEISPLLIGGAAQQFHMFLPKEGKDAPFGAKIDMPDPSGYVPPTTVVKEGETIQIDGVDFQFFTKYNVDIDDCLLVWLPQKKIALNNLLWGVMPNMYSLRGSNYRDPNLWVAGLYKIRSLQPEYVLSTHSMPIVGQAKCVETVETYADFFNYVKDQTLRAMLLGKAPQDLGSFVKPAKRFQGVDYLSETYGVFATFQEPIYQHARGWFDSDAANIFKLPRKEEAENLVEAMGGSERVLQLVDKAISENQQIWALKLVNYLYQIDPANTVYRQKKAELLYQMGLVLESQNARSWCLTQAYALTNKISLPRLIMPREMVENMPSSMLVSQYRVRINPEKAENTDFMLVFDVDGKDKVGLHCRRGVVEYIEKPEHYNKKANATVKLTHASLVDLFMNVKPVAEMLSDKSTSVNGDREKIENFLSLFDEIFNPKVNQAIPILSIQ